jgi:uncharacterized oligopeptide transporter (OPT) family protein
VEFDGAPGRISAVHSRIGECAGVHVQGVLFGAIFGIIFGAVTVYVGLRAGLTVSASIPIAVLSISLLRVFGKASILENNIVQTAGSAGESVAAGAIFTLPALIFMGFPFEYSRIFMLALIGGWIGVLFMIPLRRQLIVQEHGNLLYPEGTACADVLVAGEKGGSFASRVFWAWASVARTRSSWPPHRSGSSVRCTNPPGFPGRPSAQKSPASISVWATSSARGSRARFSPAASSPGWC